MLTTCYRKVSMNYSIVDLPKIIQRLSTVYSARCQQNIQQDYLIKVRDLSINYKVLFKVWL